MKKAFVFPVLVCAALFFSGCSTDSPPLAEAEAEQMAMTVMGSVMLEMLPAIGEINNVNLMKSRGTGDGTYTNGSGTCTIEVGYEYNDDDFYPVIWVGKITFSGFKAQGYYQAVADGSLTMTMTMDDYMNMEMSYVGGMKIVWKGERYDVIWDMECSMTNDGANATVDFSGGYTVNGYAYSLKYSYTIPIPAIPVM
ncbi:MAG: hypothetical protein JW881_05940 [Spirochaetales bacterium]|nr:hypothetical protein [Spirochaetales bacterium]